MDHVRLLRNPIREYAWGSRTALAELLGMRVPSPRPQAELWLGAHPIAPSEVLVGGDWLRLGDWIRRDPEAVLGERVAREFGGELPFLLKVLAAERPLSIQTHPDAARARAGYERENAAGIPLDAPTRSYRDPNPKPELICALTPFAVLSGFRPIDDVVAQVDELRAKGLAKLLGPLRFERTRDNLRDFYGALMTQSRDATEAIVAEAVAAAESGYGEPEVRGLIRKLATFHPGDAGALSPLFLNHIELQAGDALFLPAGELHAYLHGTAVEIMANSDNVLRGGLTPKHVDVAELLATVHFESRAPERLLPRAAGPVEGVYEAPAREFALSVLQLAAGADFDSGDRESVEIVFCSAGRVEVGVTRDEGVVLEQGAAAVVPAAAGPYGVRGEGRVYRARAPGAEVGAGSR